MKERFQNKTKKLNGTKSGSGRMEAIATTTHVGGKMFSEVGGDKQMLSRQRREIQSIAHSQPRRSGKEWVDYASTIVWVLMTITSLQ